MISQGRKRGSQPTQADIAHLAGVDQATVSRILNKSPGVRIAEKTRQKVFTIAHQLGYDLARVLHARRRAYPRLPVDIPVSLAIRLKKTKALYDRGTARILDLSPGGAFLSDLELPKRSLPLDPCVLYLEVRKGVLRGMRMSGEIIRLESNGRVSLGFSYRRILPEDKDKILAFIQINQLAQRYSIGRLT